MPRYSPSVGLEQPAALRGEAIVCLRGGNGGLPDFDLEAEVHTVDGLQALVQKRIQGNAEPAPTSNLGVILPVGSNWEDGISSLPPFEIVAMLNKEVEQH